jgi:mandelate racemase
MSNQRDLSVRAVSATPVVVPMKRAVRTASGTITEAPLLLVDLATKEGATGRCYLFGFQKFTLKPLRDLVLAFGAMIEGDALAPRALAAKLRARTTLFGARGLVGMALSAIDMAAWDAAARAAGLPLARFLGGAPKPVPAYLGNGVGVVPAAEAGREAEQLAKLGFRAIKLRIGHPRLEDDLAAARAVRKALPPEIALMTDYNQGLDVAEAIRRGRELDGEGLYWIEEPVRADDFAGAAEVAAAIETPVQIGENFQSPFELERALAAGASDYVMLDAQMLGGVTGWLAGMALAQAAGKACSSHLFQEYSAHLLAITPTAGWLEWFDIADPILREPLALANGMVTAPERPGSGLDWNEAALARYRLD